MRAAPEVEVRGRRGERGPSDASRRMRGQLVAQRLPMSFRALGDSCACGRGGGGGDEGELCVCVCMCVCVSACLRACLRVCQIAH